MTRTHVEQGPQHTLGTHGAGIEALAHRPKPVVAAGVVQYADLEIFNFALGTVMTAIDFTSVGGQNDGILFTLTGGGDLSIASAGFYGFHVLMGGFTLAANVDTVLSTQLDVISGSQGFWSSKIPGLANEGFAQTLLRANRNGTSPHDFTTVPGLVAVAYASWISTNTFPVVVQVSAFVEENNAGVAHSPDIRLTCARLGAAFE